MEVTETTSAVETTTQAPSTTPETTSQVSTSAPTTGTEPGQTEPAAYTPNYKFKVRDEEKEFDEWARPLIKDADLEAKMRDLYTKAHGLEPLKQRLGGEVESWKTKYSDVNGKYESISSNIKKLSHFVNNQDFDSFFDTLGLPKENIYKWVQAKIEEQSMTPEQRQRVAHQRQLTAREFELQQENERLKQLEVEYHTAQAQAQLDFALEKPGVSEMVQAFDEKVGQAGSFKQELIQKGFLLEQRLGRPVSVDEALQEMSKIYGKFVAAPAATEIAPQGAQVITGKPPVIPNIVSKGTSPVKQQVKSLDEMRKFAQSL